jgi:hypothetical protein
VERAVSALSAHPNIQVLGNLEADRLSIVSFTIKRGTKYLHHNFVVAVLNDLFGIQARGGCSCAGPYGHRLLGISLDASHAFEEHINRGCEGIKPGWIRINFNYFISEEVFSYIIRAISLIADHGWTLLPFYTFDAVSGRWRHKEGAVEPSLRLSDVHFSADGVSPLHTTERLDDSVLAAYISEASTLLHSLHEPRLDSPVWESEDLERLRWFDIAPETEIVGQ